MPKDKEITTTEDIKQTPRGVPLGDPRYEWPDTTPVHIPGKTDRQAPLTLREEMQRFVRQEVSRVAAAREFETFEESDDFEIEDEEPDLTSPYTVRELRPPAEGLQNDLEGDLVETRSEATGGEAAQGSEATVTPPPSAGDKPPPQSPTQ